MALHEKSFCSLPVTLNSTNISISIVRKLEIGCSLSARTSDMRCVMIFKLEKITRWVLPGNGDVPLGEVAFS